jgi:hypothetical protein
MAEQNDPIKILVVAREKLVEERRALSVAMALGYRRRRTDDNHTNEMRAAFISIQESLEAIDRAIADEKAMTHEGQASIMITELDADTSDAPRFENTQ